MLEKAKKSLEKAELIKMIMCLRPEEVREMADMYALKKLDECTYAKEGKMHYKPLGDDVGYQTYNKYVEMLSEEGVEAYNDMYNEKILESARF